MTKARKPHKVDREALYEAFNVHPGIPQHDRLELILTRLIDALADEIEGIRNGS